MTDADRDQLLAIVAEIQARAAEHGPFIPRAEVLEKARDVDDAKRPPSSKTSSSKRRSKAAAPLYVARKIRRRI
jgi:hypothetical protein